MRRGRRRVAAARGGAVQPASIKGFTVIEAIVALAIVTSGVLSLAALASQVTDTVARSRRHLSAAILADEFVVMRTGRPLAATAPDCLDRDVAACMEALDGVGRPTLATPAFVRRWRIAAIGAAPAPAWSLTACVAPVDLRRAGAPWPGACVARILAEPVR